MKKRLRKKLHLGEFQEFCFSVAWKFTQALDDETNQLFSDALTMMLKARGLAFEGKGGPECGEGYVHKPKLGSVSDADRAYVTDWFEDLRPTVCATVGKLVDAWYE